MAGSDYSLRLRATLDTTQVQQELKKLRAAQSMAFDQGGSGTNKGLQGVSHMQKIEVQLTKLNSSISGLQRAIEQLARGQMSMPKRNGDAIVRGGIGGGGGYLPGSARGSAISGSIIGKTWLGSNEFKRFTDEVSRKLQAKVSRSGGNLPREYDALKRGGMMAHKLLKSGALKRYIPEMTTLEYDKKIASWNRRNDIGRNPIIRNKELMA